MTRGELRARSRLRTFRDELPAAPILLVALGGCALSMLAATLAIRLHVIGYTARAIGLNAAAAGIAALAAAPFIPSAAARLGTARLLAVALVIAALALGGFAATRSFAAWLLLRAVEGGCATVLFVLGEFWITARVSDDWRGLMIGVYVAAVGASFALGPLLLALLDPLTAAPLLVGVGLFGIAGLVLRQAGGDAPAIVERRRASLIGYYAAAPAIMLAALLHGAIETAGLNLLPVYAASTGAIVARGALYTSLFITGAGLLQLPVGILAGRIDRARALRGLAALAAAGAAALAAIGPGRPGAFAVGLVLWGGVVGSFYPVGLGELPRRFGEDRLVGANAAFVLSYGIGTLIGPPLVGAAIDVAPAGFFVMLSGLNLAYLAVALAAVRRAA